jgi:serine-type D-Ala-D-Ala carboxypeptidase/endopeptidase
VAFGMNWMRAQNRRLKQPLIWHNGATGGFRSYLGFTGDGRFGVLVLSNGTESVDGLGVAMLRELAPPVADDERAPPREDTRPTARL